MESLKNNVKVLAVANGISFLATLIVNMFASTRGINGKTTGEISDQYPNLFVPADITFAIWIVIYLLLGVFCLFQLYIAFVKTKEAKFIENIGFYFVLSCLANMSWLFAWHYEKIGLSVCFMVVLLVSLIQIYLSLNIQYKYKKIKAYKYGVLIPISVYLGWISIATIANITVYLVSRNWQGFGLSDVLWTVIVIVVGISLGMIAIFSREDIFYALVIDWALLGIFLKRMASDPRYQSIIWVTLLGMIVLTINCVLIVGKWKTHRTVK
ncbi:MAG: tryptophan-rich sensory protein [Vallitaleaceae bacterium]|nr:tryptophan-rich sensory protein [Vallitaleaceae bacterium]